MTLAERLVELRQSRGLTQKELADFLNISRSALSLYETGKREPDYETLLKLANFFEVNVDYLLGRTNIPDPIPFQKEHHQIEAALRDDSEDEELLAFWQEMKEREDLKLLFRSTKDLSPRAIRRVIRVIKAIEEEESNDW
ncbi:helix-turn-helix domain-containing protein [Carboxydothermus pertinax]|uniref:Transcriptional regulator n=1 Tax=Carboxydothermus pertinax TaxID=870242 RepID=A0A1L8CUX6_9THEO|nr:helix-turn-helix transcriptional regulator [Carboxydothermus pertinax]GAV22664.1 transcriptional regulator [Carboxydothermus pertinax]